MTVKQFFRSNAFKSLAVLIAIVLVAGVLLAICNDIFFVSDEERFARSIAKIYGAEVETEKVFYDTNDGQTLISNFSDSYYDYFTSQNEAIAAGGYFTAIKNSSDALNNIVAGASQTSNAMVNAVNTALACFRNAISGGQA